MNLMARTAVFVGMAVVTIICCFAFSNPPTNPEAGVVVWLPEDIPGYFSQESVMSEQEKKWLPADTTYWNMSYFPMGRTREQMMMESIKATLIVAGTDSRSLHRPEVCLGAQNWAIWKREVVTLETGEGPLAVMDFSLRRLVRDPNDKNRVVLDEKGEPKYERAHYVYWWVGPDHTTPDDKKRVWLSMWNSIKKGRNERWAYPSVMTQVDPAKREVGEAEAKQRAYAFIQQYAPEFQKSLGAEEGKSGSRKLVTLIQ